MFGDMKSLKESTKKALVMVSFCVSSVFGWATNFHPRVHGVRSRCRMRSIKRCFCPRTLSTELQQKGAAFSDVVEGLPRWGLLREMIITFISKSKNGNANPTASELRPRESSRGRARGHARQKRTRRHAHRSCCGAFFLLALRVVLTLAFTAARRLFSILSWVAAISSGSTL